MGRDAKPFRIKSNGEIRCEPFRSFRIECDLWLYDLYSKCSVVYTVMNPHDLLDSFNAIVTKVCF